VDHPDGGTFIVSAHGEGLNFSSWNILSNANTGSLGNTARSVTFIVRDSAFALVNGNINFMILA
jgi:hypothetical protein